MGKSTSPGNAPPLGGGRTSYLRAASTLFDRLSKRVIKNAQDRAKVACCVLSVAGPAALWGPSDALPAASVPGPARRPAERGYFIAWAIRVMIGSITS